MSDFLQPQAIIVLVIVAVIAVVALGALLEKMRTDKLREHARSRRFDFALADSSMFGGVPFKILTKGRSQAITNVIRGTLGDVEVVLCDFKYVSGTGKNSRTHRRSLCMLRTPGRSAPEFYARRQLAFFDGLGKIFGGQDIDFPEDPAFSSAYVLQTVGSERELREFMIPKVRGAFIRLKDQRLTVENVGEHLLVEHARRLKPQELDRFLTDAMTLRASWS